MKKLWITGVSLSIFLGFQFLKAQENVVPNRGAGTCWTIEKDKNGFDIYAFHATTAQCGYFVALQKARDTAGSDIGWPAGLFVKIVNVAKPVNDDGSENAWYLGGSPNDNNRSIKFGKDAKVACYGCQPKMSGITGNLPVNCSPNDGDPAKRAACFTGFDGLDCSKQLHCSKMVDITECYQQNLNNISRSYPNDLKLCGERDIGANFGSGKNSELAVGPAKAQQATGFGSDAGVAGITNVPGITQAGG